MKGPRQTSEWRALAHQLGGRLLLPGEEAYESVRIPRIPLFRDIKPSAVVAATSESDIAVALGFARETGIDVAIRGGGHSFAGLSSTTGLLIDLSQMNAIRVTGNSASVGAGARLGSVYDALHASGLTYAGGSERTVGIGGLVLGGGIGILGRSHGLASDQVRGARVVLPSGDVVVCDDDHNPDLFWCLRGGGRLGVVTTLDLATVPEIEMTPFHRVWPATMAGELIGTWQEWAVDGPDQLSASLLVAAGPDTSDSPTAHVFGAMQENARHTAALLADLSAGAGPASVIRDSSAGSGVSARAFLAQVGDQLGALAHGRDAIHRHGWHKSEFFDQSLTSNALGRALALLDERPPGVGCEVDFMPWGGEYNRHRKEATAFVHRQDRFLVRYAVSVDPLAGAAERTAAIAWLERAWLTLHPYGTGRAYQNFPDRTLQDEQGAYYGENLPRLRRIRARYDPEGLLTDESPYSLSLSHG